ncbi:nitroreductase family protein [Mycolicibacterium chlorophenolicum]|uniref:Putative NAD(P)H nitroreductase n=1 Tax=Mycolicibacterium chlorophenolicum TaxID=37916 RepID=A0A0J6VH82_9MYCO|nr:nitroreductase family protein [Mycolicibacterium chlorophenolicum]KMO70370.1 putative NAD(P)H nitroreductase [Mycolicibacterium chlorophenolicum]
MSGPDTATLQTVLEAAAWAPSAQNSQPWRWHVDADGLHLDADWDRRLGDSPFDRCDVLLACGAVLDHCALALSAAGWGARIHRFPDRAGRLASFEVIESVPHPASRELVDMIPRRRSDRRGYGGSVLPPTTVELLLLRAARFGVQLSVVPRDRWRRLGDGQVQLHYGRGADDAHRDDDGVLVVLATEGEDDLARLRAGEAASHLLLSATALGLASCPLTDPLRSARDRLALACDVFDGRAHPQILLRIGPRVVGAAELPSALRRPLAETTTWSPFGR